MGFSPSGASSARGIRQSCGTDKARGRAPNRRRRSRTPMNHTIMAIGYVCGKPSPSARPVTLGNPRRQRARHALNVARWCPHPRQRGAWRERARPGAGHETARWSPRPHRITQAGCLRAAPLPAQLSAAAFGTALPAQRQYYPHTMNST